MPADSARGCALAEMLVGDIVTPHAPDAAHEYVTSVLVIDGALAEVSLPAVLGSYPSDPASLHLNAERCEALRAAARPAESLTTLLALVDEHTLVLAPGFGAANFHRFVEENDPELLTAAGIVDDGRGRAAGVGLVAAVAFAVLILLGLGAWVALRVVSGY